MSEPDRYHHHVDLEYCSSSGCGCGSRVNLLSLISQDRKYADVQRRRNNRCLQSYHVSKGTTATENWAVVMSELATLKKTSRAVGNLWDYPNRKSSNRGWRNGGGRNSLSLTGHREIQRRADINKSFQVSSSVFNQTTAGHSTCPTAQGNAISFASFRETAISSDRLASE
jgi:hypothetical protein